MPSTITACFPDISHNLRLQWFQTKECCSLSKFVNRKCLRFKDSSTSTENNVNKKSVFKSVDTTSLLSHSWQFKWYKVRQRVTNLIDDLRLKDTQVLRQSIKSLTTSIEWPWNNLFGQITDTDAWFHPDVDLPHNNNLQIQILSVLFLV